MTRLIDADALKKNLHSTYMSDKHAWIDYSLCLDAAPTVCCEECVHRSYPRGCNQRVYWFEWDSDKSTVETWARIGGCDCFERRQP